MSKDSIARALASGAGAAASEAQEASAQVSNKALLLAIAAKADAGNASDLPPWTYPTAWAATTAVVVGKVVVTSAKRVYICIAGGTTGSVEPTQEYPVGIPVDGSVYWAYVGGISISASDANAPTTSTGGQSAISGLGYTNSYYPTTDTANFTLLDAAGVNANFGASYPYGWTDGAGGKTAAGGALAFETEASSFAISYQYQSPPPSFRVMIDGRWNTIGPENTLTVQTGANNFNYTLFTFPGGSKTRRVIIDCSANGTGMAGIYAVHVKGNDQVRPIKVTSALAVIADSWGAGAGYAKLTGGRYPQQLGRLLGFDQTYNYSIGGTGYVAVGPGPNNTFAARIPLLIASLKASGKRLPDAWVIAGSINDNSQTSAAIQAGVTTALQNIRAATPNAPIVIVGVQPNNDGSSNTKIAANEAAQLAAVTAFNDPLVFYVPCYGDPSGPWISGTWNNTARSSFVNSGALLGNDSTHSYDYGYTYWARKIATKIRSDVYPAL